MTGSDRASAVIHQATGPWHPPTLRGSVEPTHAPSGRWRFVQLVPACVADLLPAYVAGSPRRLLVCPWVMDTRRGEVLSTLENPSDMRKCTHAACSM